MRYRISLVQTVYEEATVYVDAPDYDTAEQMALNGNAEIEWRFMEALGDVEVIDVIEAPIPCAPHLLLDLERGQQVGAGYGPNRHPAKS